MDNLGFLSLPILALVDSTSIGTLIVPVLLLVTLGTRAGSVIRTMYYLLVIGIFYWLLGVVLTAGAMPLFERFGDALTARPAMAVYAVVGALLLAWSFRIDPKAIRKRGGDPEAGARRWLTKVQGAGSSFRGLTVLAIGAGVVEVATMLPYLVAIGIIADSGIGIAMAAGVLAGYCLVMSLPAILIACGRAVAGARLDGFLERVQSWGIRHAANTLSWTVGIVGVVILLNTAPAVL